MENPRWKRKKEWVPTERLGVNYAEIIPFWWKFHSRTAKVQIEALQNQIKALEKQ